MTLQDPPRRSEAYTPGTTHNHGGMKDRWWVSWPPSFRGTFTMLLTHLSKIELCFSQKHTLIFCFLFLIHSHFDSFSSPVSPSCLLGWPRRKSPAPSCGLRLCSSQNRLHTDDSGPRGLLASSVQKECLSLPQSYGNSCMRQQEPLDLLIWRNEPIAHSREKGAGRVSAALPGTSYCSAFLPLTLMPRGAKNMWSRSQLS